jgi:tRNA(Ile)-lysidine synthase
MRIGMRQLQPLFNLDPAGLADWLLDFVRREELFQPGDRVLVAVSGGPDSVALLHLLAEWRRELALDLAVGHFDHTLRGRESVEDAAFVADLAAKLGFSFHSGRGDVRGLARRDKLSLQMAARQLRLAFLRQTCRDQGCSKLALAHTADDQVELFFLRLLRGAGPEGLKGMAAATPAGAVRPLLAVGKAALLAWLAQKNLPYRRDPSNRSRAYRRNRIRLDLLPELQRLYNPRLQEAVWRTQTLLQEEERLLALETDRLLAQVCRSPVPDFYVLDLPRLLALDPGWQLRLLRAAFGRFAAESTLTAAQTASLLDLAHGARSGGLLALGAARLARAGSELHIFRPLPPPPAGPVTLLPAPPGTVDSPAGWRWTLKHLQPASLSDPLSPQRRERVRVRGERQGPSLIPSEPHLAVFDQERLTFPLQVRYFQTGDRFWPLGAPGPRKLQDFLVDAKIPRWLRPHIPLVESGGRIVWVAGLRPAEPVKVTEASRSLLVIDLTPIQPAARRLWDLLLACRARPA